MCCRSKLSMPFSRITFIDNGMDANAITVKITLQPHLFNLRKLFAVVNGES